MTGAQYKAQRELLGTQRIIAERLGVHILTISKRENGVYPIRREVELALDALRLDKKIRHGCTDAHCKLCDPPHNIKRNG